MGLSKRYLDTNAEDISFSTDRLASELEKSLPEVVFAYLVGSAAETGIVKAHSDLDIALFLTGKIDFSVYGTAQEVCTKIVGPVRCDTGILNTAEPVYRFEALKGWLLFVRDRDLWLDFYSRTCREYESQIFHYGRQRRYRLEAKNEIQRYHST